MENSGILIHCISGWDRTPLFISLLRLSLWADGVIHKSLSPTEILYLTIAYDWYLFGHNLPDRLSKGEEILFFCFYFLKFMDGEEFSVKSAHHPAGTNQPQNPADSECGLGELLLDDISLMGYGSSSSLCSLPSECGSSNAPSLGDCPSVFTTGGSTTESLFVNCGQSEPPADHPSSTDPLGHDLYVPYGDTPGTDSGTPTGAVFHSLSGYSAAAGGLTSQCSTAPLAGGRPVPSAPPAESDDEECYGAQRSRPVSVPRGARTTAAGERHRSDSSPVLGSWQIISAHENCRESTSSRGSYRSPSSVSATDVASCAGGAVPPNNADRMRNGSEGVSGVPKQAQVDVSPRREKLERVRSLFYDSYRSVIGFKRPASSSQSLGSILGSVAEKMGLKKGG